LRIACASPESGARILRRGLNPTLTVVVPLDENIFFSEFYGRFLAGSLHAAATRGWDVHICTLRKVPRMDFREALQHLGLDSSGIIYLAEPLSEGDVQKLQGYRRPLVLTKSVFPPMWTPRCPACPSWASTTREAPAPPQAFSCSSDTGKSRCCSGHPAQGRPRAQAGLPRDPQARWRRAAAGMGL